MDEEEQRYLQSLQTELDDAQQRNRSVNKALATNMFESDENQNLIKWQLDIKEELERIEHLLRGDIPKTDEEGNFIWTRCPIQERVLNERGVREIIKRLTWYLNKNIILSNFDEEQVMQRVHQFSKYFSNFLFVNLEDFGMNTPDKLKHYPMIVMDVVNTVEASYNRALYGGERDSLRTARTVTQNENPNAQPYIPGIGGQGSKKEFSFFKPSTWKF
jgi:hypothetical protein